MYGIQFLKKGEDIRSIERTLKLLASYHAVKFSNPQFKKQYRHLIVLYRQLCQQQGVTKCLM